MYRFQASAPSFAPQISGITRDTPITPEVYSHWLPSCWWEGESHRKKGKLGDPFADVSSLETAQDSVKDPLLLFSYPDFFFPNQVPKEPLSASMPGTSCSVCTVPALGKFSKLSADAQAVKILVCLQVSAPWCQKSLITNQLVEKTQTIQMFHLSTGKEHFSPRYSWRALQRQPSGSAQ